MNSRITIESLEKFSPMGVVKEILTQPAIRLVALGSPACMASLQYAAFLLKAEDRLFYKVLSAREYALGRNSRAAVKLISQAVSVEGIKAVIVYCSCMDVLTAWEENEILAQIENPYHVPIKFLYRGPLVKRRFAPKVALKKIWQELKYEPVPLRQNFTGNYSESESHNNKIQVDFKNIILKHSGSEDILLLTPGGCSSCLFDISEEMRKKVYYTRFDDLALCKLQTADFVHSIKAYFPKEKALLLLNTMVLRAVGLSVEELCNQLQREGYKAREYKE